MSVPVIESIAVEIAARINEITVANGYNQTLIAVRPKRNDYKDEPIVDGKVLIWQGDEVVADQQLMGTKAWEQMFVLEAAVLDSDSATNSIDTRINQVRADIQKKLLIDPRLGGNLGVIDTLFVGSEKFDDGEGFSGISVNVIVIYRTQYANPYTKG